jgi:hypothetical protein
MASSNTPAGFHSALAEVVRGSPSHADLLCVIEHAHRLALAYLRVGTSSLLGVFRRLGVSAEDAAYDTIAELFARDDTRSFPVLARWWKTIPSASKATVELTSSSFRRLVIGAVHQRAFQCYHDADPHLSKIIRNIKLALKRHPSVKQMSENGTIGVVPRGCRSLRSELPCLPHELLLPELFDAIGPRARLKEMLDALGRVLLEQKEYRRFLPIVEAALMIREVYLSDASWSTTIEPSEGLSEVEIATMVKSSVGAVRQSALMHYQQRGALSQEEANAHESALADILRHYCMDSDDHNGSSETFLLALQRHLPGLTQADYRRKHRVVLEYLVKSGIAHLRKAVRIHGM